MKKTLFIIVLILAVVNFRDHPLLIPYTSKVINLVSMKAKSTAGVIVTPQILEDLKVLESVISSYEFNYIINQIQTVEQANYFYVAQCHDIELSHTVLTHYAIKKTCDILTENLN